MRNNVKEVKIKKPQVFKNRNNTNWIRQSKLAWFITFIIILGYILILVQ